MKKEDIEKLYEKSELPVSPLNGKGRHITKYWVYVGEFKKGEYEGKGTLYLFNGIEYEGEFKNGLRHGKGKELCPNGARYLGNFFRGNRQGDGMFFFENGDVYVGQFSENVASGNGVLTYAVGGSGQALLP